MGQVFPFAFTGARLEYFSRSGFRKNNSSLALPARLIKKVYEVDPLICPHGGGAMRYLAVIEKALSIERILRHLGIWGPCPPLRPPARQEDSPDNSQIPLPYHPVPGIARACC